MLNASFSPSLWEVSSSALNWPETTKPWVVTTVLAGGDDNHAHLQTMCTASGLQMVSSLSASDYELMSIQCYVIDGGRWRKRNVTEVLVGMLGEAAVAVFRDDQGNDFCPDAPDLPHFHVAELVSAGSVMGRPSSVPTSNAEKPGRLLHKAIMREFAHGQDSELSAVAVAVAVDGGQIQPVGQGQSQQAPSVMGEPK